MPALANGMSTSDRFLHRQEQEAIRALLGFSDTFPCRALERIQSSILGPLDEKTHGAGPQPTAAHRLHKPDMTTVITTSSRGVFVTVAATESLP